MRVNETFREDGMNRLILFLLVLVPTAVLAQQPDSNVNQDEAGPRLSGSVLTKELKIVSVRLAVYSSLALPASPAPSPQKAKPESTKRARETARPRTEGSMVGYIDNGIVGSQVRIRFDAGFNNSTPDLAEFFYAKCGCYRGLATAAPAAFDPNSPGPPPGSAVVIPKTLNFQQFYLNLEYAPHSRFSLFAEVPFRWIQAQGLVAGAPNSFPNQGGISDVRAGFKLALFASADHYLTFQLKSDFPSGDALRGLGTNHYSLEPVLLYYQRIGQRTAIESQVGGWHPIGGSAGVPTAGSNKFAGDVFFYGVGPSYQLYRGEQVRFTPVVELFGWHIVSGLVTSKPSDASGMNIVNLKLGARTAFGVHNSIYAGYGRALTSGLFWYKNILRVEYRYSF